LGTIEGIDNVKPLQEVAPLLSPLIALQRLLARFDDQGIIIGGVAASLLGKPRLTADVDVVMILSIEDLPLLMAAAAEEGLIPRIADAEAFASHHRVLLLRHEASGINVDISLGVLPFEVEAVERSTIHKVESVAVRLPTPEDLIVFKAVAHRPKDLLDIQAILESHPDLDRERVRYWVGEFAQALEMPEIWDDIAALL
jgi:hypothetical protein